MKIAIASDHRGFELKNVLVKYLEKKKYDVIDYGTNSKDKVDYTKYAFKVGKIVSNGEADLGILVCGSGIGMSIACNKVNGVRCAKCDNVRDAKYTRLDNNANVLAIGDMTNYKAKDIVDVFIKTKFSNETRHINRINQIKEYEENR